MAKPANADLSNLLSELKFREISELCLSAHQLQSNVKRLTWKAGKSLSGKSALSLYTPERDPALSYKSSGCSQADRAVAMDIKTFRLDWHDCSHPTSTPLALD